MTQLGDDCRARSGGCQEATIGVGVVALASLFFRCRYTRHGARSGARSCQTGPARSRGHRHPSHGQDLLTLLRRVGRCCQQGFGTATRQHHAEPVAHETDGRSTADAAAGSIDQCDPAARLWVLAPTSTADDRPRPQVADLWRPALRPARPSAVSQKAVLNVSKAASNSSDAVAGAGQFLSLDTAGRATARYTKQKFIQLQPQTASRPSTSASQ